MTWGYRHGLPLPRLGTFGAFPLDAGCGYLCPHGTWHSLLAIGQSYTEGLLILWRWENSNQRLKTSSSAFYSHEALGGLNGFNFFFFFLAGFFIAACVSFLILHLWFPRVARSWPAWVSLGKVYRCEEAQGKSSRSFRSNVGLGPASQDTHQKEGLVFPALLPFAHHGR